VIKITGFYLEQYFSFLIRFFKNPLVPRNGNWFKQMIENYSKLSMLKDVIFYGLFKECPATILAATWIFKN